MKRKKWIIAVASVGAGTVYACAPVPTFFNLLESAFFCGTVAQCDPQVERLARSGIEEVGSDPEKSPFTTIPGYDITDPLYGGVLITGGNP